MMTSIFGIGNMRKLSFLVFIICILISVKNQNAEIKKNSWPYSSWYSLPSIFLSPLSFMEEEEEVGHSNRSLEYDFYRDSCPQAERIILRVVQELNKVNTRVAPALLRLMFHDCFIEGCDASVLLDAATGIDSEKDSPPNQNLKGFDIIDKIKSEIEKVCPGVVSCADIVALAAREGVSMKEKLSVSWYQSLLYSLFIAISGILAEKIQVTAQNLNASSCILALLAGGHSIGVIHCKFFQNRLYNFSWTNKPDPSLDTGFLNLLRSRCNNNNSSKEASPSPSPSPSFKAPPPSSAPSTSFDGTKSPSTAPSLSCSGSPSSSSSTSEMRGSPSSSTAPSPCLKGSISSPPSSSASFEDSLLSTLEEPGMNMAYEGPGVDFGTLYYHGLLQDKGILYADQQLMAGVETRIWVRAYASDISLFLRDYALAMMKLSNLRVLTGSTGQVRLHCSKVA
ncbi:hypothetical protein POTOM_013330 [Populus tomentosa]|uniref:peroxidase n=1 Tax=Populus tomentosa TaxID=118781 RepID=A0A8X8D7B4_POPTO|nr:hypothetical protein POTOM_013330 [Populus tomentosa]